MTPIRDLNIRFPSLRALENKVASMHGVAFTHEKDDRGFFPTGIELDPKVQAIIDGFDARAREAAEKRAALPQVTKPATAPKAPKGDKAPSATQIVREIMLANKGADKAAIVALCVAAGVKEITAKTRFGDEIRAGIWN